MKLPNAENALVEQAKAVDYLLSVTNLDGKDKARFFINRGFSSDRWQSFADALRAQGASYDVARVIDSPHGPKFIVEGIMETPDGLNPFVRTVWIINTGVDYPRLVTAYPID